MDQIEAETEQNMLESGKKQLLSDLQKGRMIVDFIKKKSEPFTNRHFYQYFFREHEKAEKIKAL